MSFLESRKLSGLNTLLTIVLTPLILINILIVIGVLKPFNAPNKRLELHEISRMENTFFSEDLVNRILHKKPEPHKSRQFYITYSLVNTGNQAITLTDYLDNCGIMTPPWNKIEDVTSGNMYNVYGMGVYSEWSSNNQRDWFFKPVVINSNDHLDFTVVFDLDPALVTKPGVDPDSVIRWRWRLLNIDQVPFYKWSGVEDKELVDKFDTLIQCNIFGAFYFSYTRGNAWLFILLSTGLFFVCLYLLLSSRRNRYPHPALLSLYIAIILFYSIALGEITAFLLIYSWQQMYWFSYVLIVVGFISLYFLLKKREQPATTSTQPANILRPKRTRNRSN